MGAPLGQPVRCCNIADIGADENILADVSNELAMAPVQTTLFWLKLQQGKQQHVLLVPDCVLSLCRLAGLR